MIITQEDVETLAEARDVVDEIISYAEDEKLEVGFRVHNLMILREQLDILYEFLS